MDKYYYVLVDLQNKTLQLRECLTCMAADEDAVCKEYKIGRIDFASRFRYCFVGTNKENFLEKVYKYARKFPIIN